MNRPLRRLAYTIVTLFTILAIAAGYHQAIAGPSYRADPRNARLVAFRTGRERGPVVTADGVVVARSESSPDDARLWRRVYPEGSAYAHVVGFVSVLYPDRGLERAYAADLVADRGSTLSGVLRVLLGSDPRPRALRLGLEDRLQEAAITALGGDRGAIVALDPDTGTVLVMVSTPGFDPGTLVGPDAGDVGAALLDDPAQPLVDRTRQRTYPPGSTFKIVTAGAALEAGIAGPSTTFPADPEVELPGSTATISNFGGKRCGDGRTVTLEEAFTRSCNTVFAGLGMEVGAEALLATARRFGFEEEIPLDLPVVASRLPAEAELVTDPAAVAQNAIGQRDVQATPLQMALVAAAVANGGQVVVPHLVTEIVTADGMVERAASPQTWRRAMSPATAAVLGDLMERVVVSGTGRAAAVPGIRVAGKTGTAEVLDGPPHAWFVGFAPVGAGPGQRRIAIAVLVEAGGSSGETATGGTVAAPLAAEVLRVFFDVPG